MTMSWDHLPPQRNQVEAWLDRIRPALVADGGNVELVGVEHDGTVRIALQGACTTCPAQLATLRVGIEEPLKRALPGVRAVVVAED
jgi:Fe-S cluster biogenesis protein NfuA